MCACQYCKLIWLKIVQYGSIRMVLLTYYFTCVFMVNIHSFMSVFSTSHHEVLKFWAHNILVFRLRMNRQMNSRTEALQFMMLDGYPRWTSCPPSPWKRLWNLRGVPTFDKIMSRVWWCWCIVQYNLHIFITIYIIVNVNRFIILYHI